MDPSNRRGQRSNQSSAVASPTSDRNYVDRQAEATSSRADEGLSESFQSTDTVRRRPEGVSYGPCPLTSVRRQANANSFQEQFLPPSYPNLFLMRHLPSEPKPELPRDHLSTARNRFPGCASRRCLAEHPQIHRTAEASSPPMMIRMK